MASSAFKSTTKRTPIGAPVASADDSSNNRSSIHRRSRSLSRFSHRMPSSPVDKAFDEASAPRGRFVNTKRGSGLSEISLDDLAIEFFGSADRGRSSARKSEPSSVEVAAASHRRGRSVSRHGGSKTSDTHSKGRENYSASGGKGAPESNARRRRSVSVVRYQISDSESDLERSQNSGTRAKEKSFGVGNKQKPLFHKADDSNRRQTLRRALSQKDFRCHDGYSSQSSVLTDDEGKDVYFSSNGKEKTIQTIVAKKAKQPIGDVDSGFYEVIMREEIRHAVEKMRVELEQGMVNRNSSVGAISDGLHSNDSDALQRETPLTRNYSTKLGQSDKHKNLLAKTLLEEQCGRELSKTLKNLPPDHKNIVVENSSRTKKSNDGRKMSKQLSEEAEKYIEDFISNIEDTDISSLDGDRSDTSSSIGGITKPDPKIPAASKYIPSAMDGIMLPWLQWETRNDASPYPCKNRIEPPMTPKANPWNATQDASNAQDQSNHSASSQGSWSPGVNVGLSVKIGEEIVSRFKKSGNNSNKSYVVGSRESRFDMEEYVKRGTNEDFLLEKWKQQQKSNSSGILLCHRLFL